MSNCSLNKRSSDNTPKEHDIIIFAVYKRNAMVSEIFKNSLLVGAGSFIGGVLRYVISIAMKDLEKGFPWATLTANLSGCLLIGMLYGLFSRSCHSGNDMALFLTIGLCGGFTTFSTFSKEVILMLQSGNIWGGSIYIAVSAIGGLLLTAMGIYLTR